MDTVSKTLLQVLLGAEILLETKCSAGFYCKCSTCLANISNESNWGRQVLIGWRFCSTFFNHCSRFFGYSENGWWLQVPRKSWRRNVCSNCLKKTANEMKQSGLSVESLNQRSSLSGYAAVTVFWDMLQFLWYAAVSGYAAVSLMHAFCPVALSVVSKLCKNSSFYKLFIIDWLV